MPRTPHDPYADLLTRFKEYKLLSTCKAVLDWDEHTYMPPKGAALRGDQAALLAKLAHEALTSPKLGKLLAEAEASTLNDAGKVNVREIRREYDRAVKLPASLVAEMAKVFSEARQVWQDARKNREFAPFRPWLEKIIHLKQQEAAAVGFTGHVYDALLDEFEPGATTKEITKVFTALRKHLSPLVQSIAVSKRRPKTDILTRSYPVEKQKAFGLTAAKAVGFDFDRGRLDTTTHPFCMGLSPNDVRLTTRYDPKFFNESFFGILHEVGHGLYEQGLDADHAHTPLGTYTSMGIHESQSRLWENQVGRGRPFWEHFFPLAQDVFPKALADVKLDDWHFAINDVKMSFIRVEADEVTYNLHIVLRFELEQALLAGDLMAGDVPGAWNEKFEKMFGLKVDHDAHGCLQDVHWSCGLLGYFPTYTLGNLYAAQFMSKARQDLPGLDDDFRGGEFGRLKSWLNEKIHHHGQRYRAAELCKRVTGKPLGHQPLLNYLHEKYGSLYTDHTGRLLTFA
jgi:carboxypeptidase Taq